MTRFISKKALTKKLNMSGWEIYRDSEQGLYALNKELGIDHCLYLWNLTLNNPKLENILEDIRSELHKLEKENT